MTARQRRVFLDEFNGDNYIQARISSTDPAEQARIDEHTGGIGLELRDGPELWLRPMFCGGGRNREDFDRNVAKFNADPANAPFKLTDALICEWEAS